MESLIGLEVEVQPGTQVDRPMRAAVVESPRQIRIGRVTRPEPGPGQLRVRIEGCGVSVADSWSRDRRRGAKHSYEPGSPGHEGWGRIDALGQGVFHCTVGDRVALLSRHAFAEYDLADADDVVPLPPSLERMPFPGQALGSAMHVFSRGNVTSGDIVMVMGVGFLGSLLIQLATRAGAHVIAVSRRRFALDVARVWGAEALSSADPSRVLARVRARTDHRGADCVIDVAGTPRSVDLAGELTRACGRLVVAAPEAAPSIHPRIWSTRPIEVIDAREPDRRTLVAHLQSAVRAVESGDLDPESLYTHRVPLANIDRAFELVRAQPDGFLKALVMMA